MGYDAKSNDSSSVRTHAAAFFYHNDYTLVGAVDIDSRKRAEFTEKYRSPAYATIAELFQQQNPEVVALAVPTKEHYQTFEELARYSLKAVLCEKPISDNITHAREMVQESHARGFAMAVNYMRRCEPGVSTLRDMISQGDLGEIYKGVVWYSKGILNNGSHFIDLLRYLLGEVTEVQVITTGGRWKQLDPEPDVRLTCGSTEIYFLAGREEHYSLAEIELIATSGKISYESGGSRILHYQCCDDPLFSEYRILSEEPYIIKNEFHRYQYHVVQDLADKLNGKTEHLRSSGDTALMTLEIIERIRKQC
jgi:predicted dehydrogenase